MLVLFLGLEVEKYLTSRKWPALTSENDKRRYASNGFEEPFNWAIWMDSRFRSQVNMNSSCKLMNCLSQAATCIELGGWVVYYCIAFKGTSAGPCFVCDNLTNLFQ